MFLILNITPKPLQYTIWAFERQLVVGWVEPRLRNDILYNSGVAESVSNPTLLCKIRPTLQPVAITESPHANESPALYFYQHFNVVLYISHGF